MGAVLKEQVYQEFSKVTHAISNPKRMELIDMLCQRDFSVEELSKEISMSIASTSQHLQVLKSARLVETSRKGTYIIYRIADANVVCLISLVKRIGMRKNAEIGRLITDYKKDRGSLAAITLDELLARSKKERIMLIDVRPEEEFVAGHITGAISMPVDQIAKRLNEIPADANIVAYCRGALCVMASEAVKILKKKKFNAIEMEDGYVEWKAKQMERKTK